MKVHYQTDVSLDHCTPGRVYDVKVKSMTYIVPLPKKAEQIIPEEPYLYITLTKA